MSAPKGGGRERPILFSAPMVRAILSGAKTQTRRVVKPQPPAWVHPSHVNRSQVQDLFQWTEPEQVPPRKLRRWPEEHYMRCPFGFPVSRLWVRETWAPHADEEQTCRNYHAARSGEGGLTEPGVVRPEIFFRADGGDPFINNWRPSIHMPRWASRLTLEVTGVRVERLHDISEADARAEGCTGFDPEPAAEGGTIYARKGLSSAPDPRAHFECLWRSINGAESWDANPWVWVVEFRRIEAAQEAA